MKFGHNEHPPNETGTSLLQWLFSFSFLEGVCVLTVAV